MVVFDMVATAKRRAKDERDHIRQKTSIRNFVFNRYMLLRYLLSSLFIANIYWVFLLAGSGWVMIVPVVLLIFGALSMFEHIYLYGRIETDITSELRVNQLFFILQIGVNTTMIGVSMLNVGFTRFFPFLVTAFDARLFMSGVLAIGGWLSLVGLKRILHITSGTDKYLKSILEMKGSSK
jgi:hypothetical protein